MATLMKSPPLMLKSVPRVKPSGTVALISTTTPSSCSSFTWANGARWPPVAVALPDGGHDFVARHLERWAADGLGGSALGSARSSMGMSAQ